MARSRQSRDAQPFGNPAAQDRVQVHESNGILLDDTPEAVQAVGEFVPCKGYRACRRQPGQSVDVIRVHRRLEEMHVVPLKAPRHAKRLRN